MPTPNATSVLELLTDAATTAGAIDPRDSLSDADAQFILRRFNRLIGSWVNERLMNFDTYIDTLPLSAGQPSYLTSLLARGNANQWDNAFVRMSNIDYPLELVDQQTYNGIAYKPTAGIPKLLYVDTSWPDSTLNFFPVPFGPMTAYIAARQSLLNPPVSLTTVVDLPRGYQGALVDNLAVDISPSYGLVPSPQLVETAKNAKMVLKRNNRVALEMDSGLGVRPQPFNIFSG